MWSQDRTVGAEERHTVVNDNYERTAAPCSNGYATITARFEVKKSLETITGNSKHGIRIREMDNDQNEIYQYNLWEDS